jgi:hypothetical protein
MFEENTPGSEHANVPAAALASEEHADGQFDARGGEFELCEVSNIPYRNPETNNFQDRRAE